MTPLCSFHEVSVYCIALNITYALSHYLYIYFPNCFTETFFLVIDATKKNLASLFSASRVGIATSVPEEDKEAREGSEKRALHIFSL